MTNSPGISTQIAICLTALALLLAAACSKSVTQMSNAATNVNAAVSQAQPTPSNEITREDVARLIWISGTWQATGDGRLPFYERYRFDGTTLIVETFDDATMTKIGDTSRYILKDGQFGRTKNSERSAASFISDDAVQFVPVGGSGNSFRFERTKGRSWRAIHETAAVAGKPAKRTEYKMEPWPR